MFGERPLKNSKSMAPQIPNPDDRRPALPPPRFSLSALFVGTAVLGVLFAGIHYFGIFWVVIVILFVLCVVAHVMGNSLGTKLRQFGDTPLEADGTPASVQPIAKPRPADFAPVTRLRQRRPLGRRILFITGCGAIVGALLGFSGIAWLTDGPADWPVYALGACGSAVLGAIWTFAAASFIQVTFGEFLHARRESRHP